MNRILHILTALTAVLLLASCEKELDIHYREIDPLTVIEAELTPEGARVGITLTTPMGEPMDLTRLTDATVTLTDLTEGIARNLLPDGEGFYRDAVGGIVGHDYRLSVSRDGAVHEAETTMYGPAEIIGLEFNWIQMPYDYVAILQGQILDTPGHEDYYWVKLYRNGEIYKWAQMSDKGAEDGILTFMTMTTRRDTDEEEDDEVLYDGDIMTATVTPISRPMHDYLEALQNDSNGPALFSGERCLGYFLASAPTSKTITFRPSEIPVYRP